MDPCKIIALSYHYIRCFVAMTTAISRNSGRRLNISLSLVPIATKVRPATHICFHSSPALVRAIAWGLEMKKTSYQKWLAVQSVTQRWNNLTYFIPTVAELYNSLKQPCISRKNSRIWSCSICPFPGLLSHHKTRLISVKAWLLPAFNPDGQAFQIACVCDRGSDMKPEFPCWAFVGSD